MIKQRLSLTNTQRQDIMKDDYVVALYLRISDEDEENALGRFCESESISGQRMILTDFVCQHEELSNSIIVEVIDDGYSGTNFVEVR